MIKMLTFAAAALATVALAPAQAFTLVNTTGGDGYVVTPDVDFTFTLHGTGFSTSPNAALFETQYTETATVSRDLNFSYSYRTSDGSSALDPAGYMINGELFQLTPDNLAWWDDAYTGNVRISVVAGDVYGFYVNSSDGRGGRGHLSVLAAAVPEPATWAMMLTGFGLVGASIRRRRAAVVLN